MSMLTREQAEPILALHASGERITEISLRLGVSRPTVRSYVRGHRAPGSKPRPKPDHFAPFASYCRQRLTDDPHLSRALLRQELAGLGYPGSRMSFSRAIDRHELLQLACQNRHEQPPAPVKPRPPGSNGPARPLPITVSPISGETLSSYLGRVAAANHITATALLALLPRWFPPKSGTVMIAGSTPSSSPRPPTPFISLPPSPAAPARHSLTPCRSSPTSSATPPNRSGRPQPASGAWPPTASTSRSPSSWRHI